MRSWIIFLGLLFTTFTQAQVITGRVTDLNNHPIELAVVIIQTNDSVYVNSTYTDSLGSFSVKAEISPFLLTVQHLLGVYLFCFGVFWNLCDISLNTQGIGIERLYGRTIMASFHGGWSLAACLGALIGFIMIVSGVTPFWHFTLIALLIVMIVLVSRNTPKQNK